MPIEIVRNDITRMHTDAIVNAANQTLLGGGGVDGAIHRAAGPGLLEECRGLNGCETGMAKITGGYNLPAKHVIHTVGPVWHGGGYGEADLLAACYRNSLMLATRHGCESVAFPLISAGAYGYPKDQALKIALDTIRDYLLENDDMMVYLVLFDKTASALGSKLYAGVRKYIDDHYVDLHSDTRSIMRMRYKAACAMPRLMAQHDMNVLEDCSVGSMPSLEDALSQLDESFSQMVLRRIDEKGISDSACYKKANIDRKLFSKIRSDVHYKPSKRTALALAIALELNLADTRDLLMKAGFALSRSNKFDIIIEYFIVNGRYDIHEINETLFFFDQALLGG